MTNTNTVTITTEYVTEYNGMLVRGHVARAIDASGKVVVSTWPESLDGLVERTAKLAEGLGYTVAK